MSDDLDEDLDDATGEIDISELEGEGTLSNIPNETQELSIDSDLSEDEFDDELEMDALEEIEDEPTREHASIAEENIDIEIDDRFAEEEDEEELDRVEHPAIAKIKAQLPFLSKLIDKIPKKAKVSPKSSSGDHTRTEFFKEEDLEEEVVEDSALISNLKKQLPFLAGIIDKLSKKKSKSLKDDFDPDEVAPIKYAEDEDEEKPKRKITPIHIIFILVVGYVGYDYIMNPEGESPEQTTTVVKKPKRPKANKQPKAKIDETVAKEPAKELVVENKPVEKPAVESPTTETTEESLDDLFADDKPKTEEVDVQEPKTEVPAVETTNETATEVSEKEETPSELENIDESSPMDVVEESNERDEDQSTELSENEDASSTDEVSAGEENNSVNTIDPSLLNTDSIVDDIAAPADTTDITESILKDLEVKVNEKADKEKEVLATKPVDAPEYEMVGRALVYNCKGKHWACIDSVSFETCRKNYSWNSLKGRTVECYPLDSYDTIEDCATIQQFKIDNVSETNFCN